MTTRARYGAGRYDRIRDAARLAVAFPDAAALVAAVASAVAHVDGGAGARVVEVENRFAEPTALGWRDVSLLVEIPIASPRNVHVAEVQLQIQVYATARKQAHAFYRSLREALPECGIKPEDLDAAQPNARAETYAAFFCRGVQDDAAGNFQRRRNDRKRLFEFGRARRATVLAAFMTPTTSMSFTFDVNWRHEMHAKPIVDLGLGEDGETVTLGAIRSADETGWPFPSMSRFTDVSRWWPLKCMREDAAFAAVEDGVVDSYASAKGAAEETSGDAAVMVGGPALAVGTCRAPDGAGHRVTTTVGVVVAPVS